jgi:hypothetical protein
MTNSTDKQRPFYIIGHNPNTVSDALDCLARGANAIEPDVHFWPRENQFAVYHSNPADVPTLEAYLGNLDLALRKSPELQRRLALIAFDIKTFNFDLKRFFDIVRSSFTLSNPQVSVLVTVANRSEIPFLHTITGFQNKNEAIGIDEDGPPSQFFPSLLSKGLNVAYANGSTVRDPWRYEFDFKAAVRQRGTRGLKFVYAWSVNGAYAMKSLLDLKFGIDGMITDEIEKLKALVESNPYKSRYRIANNEDKPFEV